MQTGVLWAAIGATSCVGVLLLKLAKRLHVWTTLVGCVALLAVGVFTIAIAGGASLSLAQFLAGTALIALSYPPANAVVGFVGARRSALASEVTTTTISFARATTLSLLATTTLCSSAWSLLVGDAPQVGARALCSCAAAPTLVYRVCWAACSWLPAGKREREKEAIAAVEGAFR